MRLFQTLPSSWPHGHVPRKQLPPNPCLQPGCPGSAEQRACDGTTFYLNHGRSVTIEKSAALAVSRGSTVRINTWKRSSTTRSQPELGETTPQGQLSRQRPGRAPPDLCANLPHTQPGGYQRPRSLAPHRSRGPGIIHRRCLLAGDPGKPLPPAGQRTGPGRSLSAAWRPQHV